MERQEEQQRREQRLRRGMKRATAMVLTAAALVEMLGVAFIRLDKKRPRR